MRVSGKKSAGRLFDLRRFLTALLITGLTWSILSPERLFFPGFGGTGADDASYVAYSMSVGLDADLDFSNEIADRLGAHPNGRTLPVHPSGPGLMASPVVAALSVFDRVAGHPVMDDRDTFGGSWSYFGFFIASAAALLAGAYLAIKAVVLTTGAGSLALTAPTLLILLAGTGLPYYGLKRFTMGHSFEFFAAALILWSVITLRRSGKQIAVPFITLTGGVFASLIVRPANINIVLLPFIVYLTVNLIDAQGRNNFRQKVRTLKVVSSATAIGVALTFWLNRFLYANPYPSLGGQYERTRSVEASSSSASPLEAIAAFTGDTVPRAARAFSNLLDLRIVFFSQEFGLAWFMPLAAFGGFALVVSIIVLLRRGNSRRNVVLLGVMATAYVAVPLGVVLEWQSHASSFGFRYVFSLVPLGLLGIVLAGSAVQGKWQEFAFRTLIVSIVVLSFFSLLGQIFFGTDPTVSLSETVNSFGRQVRFGAPGYATALLTLLLQPTAWINMLARGLPGFIGLILLPSEWVTSLAASGGVAPNRRFDSVEALASTYGADIALAAPGLVPVATVTMLVVIPYIILRLERQQTYMPETDKTITEGSRE